MSLRGFLLSGSHWRLRAFAFLSGCSATLTLAPFHAFPFIIPAYGGLFLLLSLATTAREGFRHGFWWGWGFHISGLYWFSMALLTDVGKFGWAIPLALFALTAIIALYAAVTCWLVVRLWQYVPAALRLSRLCVFALVWLLLEYARSYFFSGFPWNLAGYAFSFTDSALQLASVFGAYGLTLAAVFLGAASVALSRRANLALWLTLALALVWGGWRLQHYPQGQGEATGEVLRVVQANVDKPHNWDPKRQYVGLQSYLFTSQMDGLERVTHLIWPESAIPYALRTDSTLLARVADILPPKTTLISGAVRTTGGGDTNDFTVYNSIVAINAKGELVGTYDKHKLVPFGEFLPLRWLIPSWLSLPVGDVDFTPGTGTGLVRDWPTLQGAYMLICYEAIFPGLISREAGEPRLLLNLTNDVWFGHSTGPQQHFDMARMRAVEQGIPLVRAANTGISAYVDDLGRIEQMLPLGTQGVLDIELRRPQLTSTVYSRVGEGIVPILGGILLLLVAVQYRKRTTRLTNS
jgi:apolipoprotein N-acyltransferase